LVVAFRIAAEVSEDVLANAARDLVDKLIALGRVVTGASRVGCCNLREDASGEWRTDSPASQCTTDHVAHGIRKFTPKLPSSFGVAVPDPAGHRSQIVHRLVLSREATRACSEERDICGGAFSAARKAPPRS
jgi:hypothetical protein